MMPGENPQDSKPLEAFSEDRPDTPSSDDIKSRAAQLGQAIDASAGTHGLHALGASAEVNAKRYRFDGPDARILEKFPNPALNYGPVGKTLAIEIEAPEFTSLCPVTGQPDFATIHISYVPNRWCVESKSLKLYLMGFRQYGSFHEEIVAKIREDLTRLLMPCELAVTGRFAPRGGIAIHPTSKTHRS